MAPVKLVAVQGTWGWNDVWWQDGSAFWNWMRRRGVEPVRVSGKPFEWETGLGSSIYFWRRWGWGRKGVEAWEYAGKAFYYYCDILNFDECNVLAHSHGGQVALYGAAEGIKIRKLVTVGTPVRADLEDVLAKALPNISEWWHLYDKDEDRTAERGAFGDGRLGRVVRTFLRDKVVNVGLPGIGHSGLLKDPSVFHFWDDQGVLEFLRQERAA